MDRMMRFGLIAAVAAIALLVPTRAASDTPPPVIEVTVSLTDLPPAIVNLTVPEQAAPVVNLPEFPTPAVTVEQGEPTIVYKDRVEVVEVPVDRVVETERVVEVPVDRVVEVEVPVEVERLVEVIVEVEVPVEVIVICNPADGRERTFAFIDGGIVTNLAGGSGSDFEDFLGAVSHQGQEVTCLQPSPAIGWTFDGEVFAPPS